MRDLFLQCAYVTYVSVTLRNVNLHSRARRGTHASCALTHEDTGCAHMAYPHAQCVLAQRSVRHHAHV